MLSKDSDYIRKRIIKTAEPGPIPGDPDAYPEGVLNPPFYGALLLEQVQATPEAPAS